MNRKRYEHFTSGGGKSPFSRGFCRNLADFFNVSIYGFVKAQRIDWTTRFDFDRLQNIEDEPLLIHEQKENTFQYV